MTDWDPHRVLDGEVVSYTPGAALAFRPGRRVVCTLDTEFEDIAAEYPTDCFDCDNNIAATDRIRARLDAATARINELEGQLGARRPEGTAS